MELDTKVKDFTVPYDVDMYLGHPNKDSDVYVVWFTPFGDELMVTDGRLCTDGNYSGFLKLMKQGDYRTDDMIRDLGYNIGSSDETAEHGLFFYKDGLYVDDLEKLKDIARDINSE